MQDLLERQDSKVGAKQAPSTHNQAPDSRWIDFEIIHLDLKERLKNPRGIFHDKFNMSQQDAQALYNNCSSPLNKTRIDNALFNHWVKQWREKYQSSEYDADYPGGEISIGYIKELQRWVLLNGHTRLKARSMLTNVSHVMMPFNFMVFDTLDDYKRCFVQFDIKDSRARTVKQVFDIEARGKNWHKSITKSLQATLLQLSIPINSEHRASSLLVGERKKIYDEYESEFTLLSDLIKEAENANTSSTFRNLLFEGNGISGNWVNSKGQSMGIKHSAGYATMIFVRLLKADRTKFEPFVSAILRGDRQGCGWVASLEDAINGEANKLKALKKDMVKCTDSAQNRYYPPNRLFLKIFERVVTYYLEKNGAKTGWPRIEIGPALYNADFNFKIPNF